MSGNGVPPYRIETERLVLRCWDPRDAPLLKDAIDSSLDHLRPWMPWAREEPKPLEETLNHRGAENRIELRSVNPFNRSRIALTMADERPQPIHVEIQQTNRTAIDLHDEPDVGLG